MQAPDDKQAEPISTGPRELALNAHIQKYQALLEGPGDNSEKNAAMADAIFDTTCSLFLNITPVRLHEYAPLPRASFNSTEEFLESPVRQFSTAGNMLMKFIEASTLTRDDNTNEASPNIDRVRMWLAVADELRRKNDFNSLQNVISALVKAVKLCGNDLTAEEKEVYNSYRDVFTGSNELYDRVRPGVKRAANNGQIVIPQLSMFTSEQEKIRTEQLQLNKQLSAGVQENLANQKQANINQKENEFFKLFNRILFLLPKGRSPSVEERNLRLAAAQKQLDLETSNSAIQESRASSLEKNRPQSPMAAQASSASLPAAERRGSMESKSFISRLQQSVGRRFSFGGSEQEKPSSRRGSDPANVDDTAIKAAAVFKHPETSDTTKKVGADTLGRLINEVSKLMQLKQTLESTNKKDANTLAQISQLSMGISSTNAKIEEMRAKIVTDSIESKKQQNPKLISEKGGELFKLNNELITHLTTQKNELGKVIESLRQNMKDNKRPSSANEHVIMELQSLQAKVDGINKQLHVAELNKIKLSDPKALREEYEESLFNKSTSLFTELERIKMMPEKSSAQLQAQNNSLKDFSEKLNMHKEMVYIFVENASSSFTKLSEIRDFKATFTGPIADLINESATLKDQNAASLMAIQQGKDAGKGRSFTQSL